MRVYEGVETMSEIPTAAAGLPTARAWRWVSAGSAWRLRRVVASSGSCEGGRMRAPPTEASGRSDASPVRYLDIEVSSAGIAELGRDRRPVVSVPREELKTVELRYGPPGERLLAQTATGATVLVVGLALGRAIVAWLLYGGYANLNAGAGSGELGCSGELGDRVITFVS